ncbi:hypothetical protein DSM104299_00968 [Baekduia alba]|uniref:hypothetical protein n=1 Tax=Baekduia alba TaxID=2997333 RepID=UPI002341064B|nr:hypothetical protein [Baekduia alba]WCB92278.1 hypothetical protein DSM104299_00968 [Baekduia alba]
MSSPTDARPHEDAGQARSGAGDPDRVAQLVATLTVDDDMYEFRRLLAALVPRG